MKDAELRRLLSEMRQQTAELHEQGLRHAESLNADTRDRRETLTAKTEAGFEVVNHKIDLLADSFLLLHEKLEREAADIRLEMRQGFTDTHALIRFAYRDPDRRVRVVEAK